MPCLWGLYPFRDGVNVRQLAISKRQREVLLLCDKPRDSDQVLRSVSKKVDRASIWIMLKTNQTFFLGRW